ncbi:MAG: hypothetical protein JJ863_00605 [Deltaproteobacteria bacterium]|nr:hypothetical protein [Deltaproteobacteria bacterium]
MKHVSLLLLSIGLAACSAEPTVGADPEALVRVGTPIDAGPPPPAPTAVDDFHAPPGGCWFEPDPTHECLTRVGREPPCPTCLCKHCGRFDWWDGKHWALIQAGTNLEGLTLADHAVLSPHPGIGGAKLDHEFVDIDPSLVANGYQAVVVPEQYAQKDQLYIYFVTESGNASTVSEAALIPKI